MLGEEPMEEPEAIQRQDCFKDTSNHPELCPVCGKPLVVTSVLNPTGMIPHSGAPPLLKPFLRKAAYHVAFFDVFP